MIWGNTITLLVIVAFLIVIIPASAADEPSDTALTRGSRFSVNITGLPDTPYYVWLTKTSAMTGKPGDQPPVIVAFQSNIQQDPPEGPYTIGSYLFNNGNGHTIRDNVAPSTQEMSNTRYYALVTTDTDGRAVVSFHTTSSTATRTFSIKVENPSSAANNNILVRQGTAIKDPDRPATRTSGNRTGTHGNSNSHPDSKSFSSTSRFDNATCANPDANPAICFRI